MMEVVKATKWYETGKALSISGTVSIQTTAYWGEVAIIGNDQGKGTLGRQEIDDMIKALTEYRDETWPE